MNDPGLEDAIAEDAKDVEHQATGIDAAKRNEEQEFLEPSRWWFLSTAFPLIAGTFGPMGSAFSICALVVPWRVYIPPGAAEQNGVELKDPKWLIGINALQLVVALISNLFLLLMMAKRVRFYIAQPIIIIGWYISSVALIGLCACASGPLIVEPRSSHAFTQAYYYAIFSAVLYFIVATLMLITAWGAQKGHYAKEFQLTMSQRTLMLQTISFLVYLLAGAAVYSHIEGWKYLDAVYWADFTLLTVGIGDYAPTTHLGRSLLFPFAFGGITILGLVIGSIRSLVLERGKVKLGARIVEKERRRLLKRISKNQNSPVLEPLQPGDQATIPRAVTSRKFTSPGSKSRRGGGGGGEEMTELSRRKQEFSLMRQIQEEAATRRRWTSLVISAATWFGLWFIGAAIFEAAEASQDWSYFGSMYFAYTSLLTIGYGDFVPQSNSGKSFFVVWSLLAVPSLTILIGNMGDTIVKMIRDATLWLGNLTVLPGEKHGVRKALKKSFHQASRGQILAALRLRQEGEEDAGDDDNNNNNNIDRMKDSQGRRDGDASSSSSSSSDNADAERRHHIALIQEIARVTKHLDANPSKKYSYEEWTRYLRLVGEDESSAETHRKAEERPEVDDEGVHAGADVDGDCVKWSWIGSRSPLMGDGDEARWVLDRLVRTLGKELESTRRREVESRGGGGGGGGSRREGDSNVQQDGAVGSSSGSRKRK